LECAFGVVGKILMRGCIEIYLVRFGSRMWEILIFKLFLPLIQINSKKPGFGRQKSVEDMVTLGPRAQATLVYIKKCLKAKEKIMETQTNRPVIYGPISIKLQHSLMNLNTISLPW
jgi:hypothetical protein